MLNNVSEHVRKLFSLLFLFCINKRTGVGKIVFIDIIFVDCN